MSGFIRHAYDGVAEAYLRARRHDQHDLPFVDLLADQIQPGGRVLDVGCGAGLPIAAHLVSRGLGVIGIDISEVQVALARRNVPEAEFSVRDMTDLEEGDFEVDAVVAFYSVFHTPREGHARLLKVLRSFVPAGGRILCTFGSTEWEGEELFFGTPMRWSHYGPETSLRLVAEAGWDIESSQIVEHRFEAEMERHLMVMGVANNG